MADTLESGNEGSVNLAPSPEQSKVDSVKSNQEKFAEVRASLRGKEPPKVEKAATTEISKQVEPEKVVETKDTKPVKESSSDNKFKYTKEEGRIKALERKNNKIAKLERELNELKQKGSKTRDEYETDADFIQDLSERKANEVALNREYQREKADREQEEREIYMEKVESQVKDVAKHKALAMKYAESIDNDALTNEYIFKSPVGIKMLDAILDKFENEPGAKEAFFNMPTAKKNLLLVNLERIVAQPEVSNEPKSDELRVSKAPNSITPIKGENISAPVDAKSRFEQVRNELRAKRAQHK